jgi:hypothetical protein
MHYSLVSCMTGLGDSQGTPGTGVRNCQSGDLPCILLSVVRLCGSTIVYNGLRKRFEPVLLQIGHFTKLVILERQETHFALE